MIGSMSTEFASRPGALAWRFLGALGFVLFGAFALLDASSALVTRGVGVAIMLSAGLFAWLYVREAVRPGTVLTLDRDGLHLRRRPPEPGFDHPWSALAAVRLQSAAKDSLVALDFLEGSASGSERDDQAGWTTVLLPDFIGVPADEIVAEVERFRRAYTPIPFSTSIVARPER